MPGAKRNRVQSILLACYFFAWGFCVSEKVVAGCHVAASMFPLSKTSPFNPTEPPPEISSVWPLCASSILLSTIQKVTLLLQPNPATDFSHLPLLVNPLAWNILSPSPLLSDSYFLYNTDQALHPSKLCLATPAHPGCSRMALNSNCHFVIFLVKNLSCLTTQIVCPSKTRMSLLSL